MQWVGYVTGIPRVRNSNTAPVTVYTIPVQPQCPTKPAVSLVPTGYWYKNLLPDYKLHTTVLDILTIEKTRGILILSRVLSHHNNNIYLLAAAAAAAAAAAHTH